MQITEQAQAIRVIGLELRTHNGEAAITIPPHWGRFIAGGGPQAVPGRLSDDVYAVYTHFADAGRSNQGLYSLIIGCAVPPEAPLPAGLAQAVLPAGPRAEFAVPDGQPQQVGAVWQQVWQRDDLPKAFVADCEHYRPVGRIRIAVGLRQPA